MPSKPTGISKATNSLEHLGDMVYFYEMRSIVIACPKGNATGGPEALHQLFYALKNNGYEVSLWDPNLNSMNLEPVNGYSAYEPKWTTEPPQVNDVLIIPEIMGHLVPLFYWSCPIVFWWLSVDNFYNADRIQLREIVGGFSDVIHCYQSEYARLHLVENGIHPALPLSDYINEEFISSAKGLVKEIPKVNSKLLAVNPAKGFDRTSTVLKNIDPKFIVKLEGMTRKEVIESLEHADVYMDLGNHPGMDRFPREAALMGCVVVTNQRGAAGNERDIPIPFGEFKFDDEEKNFEVAIVNQLNEIFATPNDYFHLQDSYRKWIENGKIRFSQEVKELINAIECIPLNSDMTNMFSLNSTVRSIFELMAERDAVIAERDAVIAERDAVIAERDAVMAERDAVIQVKQLMLKSYSWRLTGALRVMARSPGILKRYF